MLKMAWVKKYWKVLVAALFVVVMAAFAVSTTTVTETLVSSPSGSYTNLQATVMNITQLSVTNVNVSNLNNVLYVQAGNASDIQAKINLCDGVNSCTVIIPPSTANYTISTKIQLPSNMYLKIKNTY